MSPKRFLPLTALAFLASLTPPARAFVTFSSFGPDHSYFDASITQNSSYDYGLYFTPAKTITLGSITFPIQIFNSPHGISFTVQLQANSATDTPGTSLATFNVPYAAAAGRGGLVTVTQPTPDVTLTAGVTYWLRNTVNSTSGAQAGNWYMNPIGLRNNYLWSSDHGATWQRFTPNNLSGAFEVAGYVPADVNDDGLINRDDYAALDRFAAKHPLTSTRATGDLNTDGLLDAADYAVLDTAYAAFVPQDAQSFIASHAARFGDDYLTSVPEPISLSLLLPALALKRRRPSS
jgi:hypothetical protein